MLSQYNQIFKRKSTRKFIMEEIEYADYLKILAFTENVKKLYQIQTHFEIVQSIRNLTGVKAPHYLTLYSEPEEGYLENAGFMLQQVDLRLSCLGLGSCWIGSAHQKAMENSKLVYVASLAFGKSVESPYRELSQFDRKDILEISKGTDERIVAAQYAPSASNGQHWFFVARDGKVDVYQKQLGVTAIMYDKLNRIDIGIAIAHLYYATIEKNKKFTFELDNEHKKLDGYIYRGTVR